jgi:glycosyltransferase involved in cell wall biosynthesis
MLTESHSNDKGLQGLQRPRLEKPVRITEQVWPEGTVPVVSMLCVTYNHAKFIRDAIEGFLMQETSFPVQIVIHDDASTDGTSDILREYAAKYPQLFRNIIQPTNLWPNTPPAVDMVRKYCRGDFIALCEADDYWTNKSKLELQVKTLQANSCIVMIGGCCNIIDEQANSVAEICPRPCNELQMIKCSDYFPGHPNNPWIHSCTRVFSKRHILSIPSEYGIDTLMLHWIITKYPKHKIAYLPDVVGTYRLHEHGWWSAMNTRKKNIELSDIYGKAATLHKGQRKLILLEKALESLDFIVKDRSISMFRRTPYIWKYWKVRRAVNRLSQQLKKAPTTI